MLYCGELGQFVAVAVSCRKHEQESSGSKPLAEKKEGKKTTIYFEKWRKGHGDGGERGDGEGEEEGMERVTPSDNNQTHDRKLTLDRKL